MEPNRDAASAMEEYLEMQDAKKLPTSMADVQSKYSAIPYGWKEIDIAAVAAQLIVTHLLLGLSAWNRRFSKFLYLCTCCPILTHFLRRRISASKLYFSMIRRIVLGLR